MTDFKAKMHQIRFRLGLRPRPRWGSLQRSPRSPSWIWGPTTKERERKGRGREGRRGKGREGKERAMTHEPPPLFGGSLRLCQIRQDWSSSPVDLWRCAIRRGHVVEATQRPPPRRLHDSDDEDNEVDTTVSYYSFSVRLPPSV